MILDRITPRWQGHTVIVAATGVSLTSDVAETCRRSRCRIIAVNDAYRLLPFADILYACDGAWWDAHKGCPGFAGEKWSSHGGPDHNDKRLHGERYGLTLVRGSQCHHGGRGGGCADGGLFSTDPTHIHYGGNSGFQALNLAILFGARRIALVGFNMDGRGHFFGAHPRPLRNVDHSRSVMTFTHAWRHRPAGVEILNATPESALRGFPRISLEEALQVPA